MTLFGGEKFVEEDGARLAGVEVTRVQCKTRECGEVPWRWCFVN